MPQIIANMEIVTAPDQALTLVDPTRGIHENRMAYLELREAELRPSSDPGLRRAADPTVERPSEKVRKLPRAHMSIAGKWRGVAFKCPSHCTGGIEARGQEAGFADAC